MSITVRPGADFTAIALGLAQGLEGTLTFGVRRLPEGTLVIPETTAAIVEYPQGDGTSNYEATRTMPIDADPGRSYLTSWPADLVAEQEDIVVPGDNHYYEINEIAFSEVPVYSTKREIVNAAVPKSGIPVRVKDAGSNTTRPVFDQPGGTELPQPLTSVNGRIEGYIAGEDPVDLIFNAGQPNEYVQRFSPPQAGPHGDPGPPGPVDTTTVKMANYPLTVPEVDDTARIMRAKDALPASGGIIDFQTGQYEYTTLDFLERSGVMLRGQATRESGGGAATVLMCTAGAGVARAIDARNTVGFDTVNIAFHYSNAAFTGKLIDRSRNDPSPNPSNSTTFGCSFHSSGSAIKNCAAFLSFSGGHSHNVKNCAFGRAQASIKGRDSNDALDYSNAVSIEGCSFNDSVLPPVQNAGEAWTIDNCVFEPLDNGHAGAYTGNGFFGPMNQSFQLAIQNCWFGDSSDDGEWVYYTGVGLTFQNNRVMTAVGIHLTAQSKAAVIIGNDFRGLVALRLDPNCGGIKCEPNNYAPGTAKAVTGAAATDTFTSNGHGYANGDMVVLNPLTGGAGLVAGRPYFVIGQTANTFQLAVTPGGAAVDFTTDVVGGSVSRPTIKLQMIGTDGVTVNGVGADSPAQAVGPSRARARTDNSAAQHTGGGGAWAKVGLNTPVCDNDTMWDPAGNRLVIVTPGLYLVNGQVTFVNTANQASGNRLGRIMTGPPGATTERARGGGRLPVNVGDFATAPIAAGAIDLAVGDVIELWGFQDSGGDLAYDGSGTTFLSAARLAR